MKIENLPPAPRQPNGSASPRAINPLVFSSFDDTPDNPRPGLGYQQLFDRTRPVTLTAKLPDVTRVGDTIKLFWDDDAVPVQTYDLDQATIDKGWLSFSVSVDVIKAPEGKAYYTLFDHQAENLQTSDTRTVKVNRNVPGGLDPDTDTAINEALAPLTVSPSTINSPDTQVSVTVQPWAHMEAGDELVVLWNGIRVSAPVLTQAGVGMPQVVSIPQAVVKQGGSSEKLPVNYEIRDIVDNYSLLSLATLVDVNIDANALPAPRLADANAATNQIDLEVLGAKDARVQVQTGALTAGNVVTLTWTGRTPTTELSETLPGQTVTDPGFEVLLFNIPNAKVVAFAGGSISAKYTVGAKVSKSANATLSGLVIPVTAPELEGAVGGVIDLGVVTGNPLIVSAPAYVGQKAGDRILLSWAGTSATGVPVNYPDEYTVQVGEEAEEIYFEVPRQNLDPLGGGTLQLSYQVVRASGVTQNSPITAYQVRAEPVVVFDAPQVREATFSAIDTQWLDYYEVNDDIHIIVPITQLAPNDTVKVFWVGRNTTIKSETLTVETSPEPLELVISKYEVIDVIGYATTDIYYTVKKQGISDTYTSNHLKLSVTGHSFTIKAPTINSSNNNLFVWRQDKFNDTTTARVRAIGVTDWEVEHNQKFGAEKYLNFPIDPAWLAANRGHSVVFDYSLRLNTGDTRWLFSQLLRVNPL
jgi:hypothetical protein